MGLRRCDYCGKPITGRGKRYCSLACFYAHRRAGGPRAVCRNCGREYRPRRHAGRRKFCSRACANRAHSRAVRENAQAYRAGRSAVVRQGCGKTFHVARHRSASARYCSKACLFVHRFAPKSGERDRAGSNNLHAARDSARKHLGEKSLLCGFDVFVETHHILARRDGGTNRIENLSLLCPNHHKMAHLGLVAPAELTRLTLAALARGSGRLPLFDPPRG
jgi:hypothetical protein